MLNWRCALGTMVGVMLLTTAARADEPVSGFVYTTDLLPKGKKEIEQWLTLREGRSQGDFHVLQTQTEVSYGVTDAFQLSGNLLFAYANAKNNAPDGTTAPPEVFADYDVSPVGRFRKARFEGAAVEGIYRFMSPYLHPFGAAFYFEPTIGPRTRELEMRLILQKNFLDDRLVFAFNIKLAYELRKLHADPSAPPGTKEARLHWDHETDVNFGLMGSYRFAPNWSGGLELQNEREWAGFNPLKGGKRTNQVLYFGPSLHFGGKHFFGTFTTLFQLPVAKDYENKGANSFIVHGISNADDFEKYRFRLKVGYYF